MTTVNTVEDIIEALDADPLLLEAFRARLLTRELLELPRVVDELAASHLRLESAFHQFAGTAERFMETTNARLGALEENQREMAESQRELRANQQELAENQRELRANQQELAENQRELRANQNDMKLDLDSIRGDHMELRLQGKVESLLFQRMSLRRVRIVRALYPAGSDQRFLDAVYEAEENGVITIQQYTRILDTDMILSGRRRRGGEDVYVAMEVANKLDRDDADRAIMSAEALALALRGAEVLAAVYGREISDADKTRAESGGVAVILDESRR